MNARNRNPMFAALAALPLFAGCLPDDEEPIPQAESAIDLERDDDAASARQALTAEADGPAAATGGYDRQRALRYARKYARDPNPKLAYCGLNDGTPADCTNFASQVLWYGGVPMRYSTSDETGWWYRYSCLPSGSSKSWRQVNRLLSYLVTESAVGEFRRNARDLQVGDLIFYRLRQADSGYRCDAGNLFNHSTVVTGFDGDGDPLVSYHSNEALDVPWDARSGSRKALGEACATAFVHIR